MFITKKHLSRRTFLRGAGVTLALPLLESMIPARTLLGTDGGEPRTASGIRVCASRRGDGPLDARDGRRRLRVPADPETARAVPRPA